MSSPTWKGGMKEVRLHSKAERPQGLVQLASMIDAAVTFSEGIIYLKWPKIFSFL